MALISINESLVAKSPCTAWKIYPSEWVLSLVDSADKCVPDIELLLCTAMCSQYQAKEKIMLDLDLCNTVLHSVIS